MTSFVETFELGHRHSMELDPKEHQHLLSSCFNDAAAPFDHLFPLPLSLGKTPPASSSRVRGVPTSTLSLALSLRRRSSSRSTTDDDDGHAASRSLGRSPDAYPQSPDSRSTSTDPWSMSGFIEEQPVMDASGDEHDDEHDHEQQQQHHHHDDEDNDDNDDKDSRLIELKLEVLDEDEDVHMELMRATDAKLDVGPDRTRSTSRPKRPRGRPRKHPLHTVDPSAKVQKGRSKTGCITCRRRKKKCDEAKPHCSNCKKNGVLCEGYQPLTIWKPKKDKGAGEGAHSPTRRPSMSLMGSTARSSPFNLPPYELAPIIHGVVTVCDRIFLDHYCYRLSAVLTVEGPHKNAFKDMLLPLAVQHLGLMHSVLALASSNIEYHEPYGKLLLARHDSDEGLIRELEERSEYHRVQALELFHRSADQEKNGVVEKDAQAVRYAQMLCRIVQNLAEGERSGEHRLHLDAYRSITNNHKAGPGGLGIDEPFASFIEEYFRFHIGLDDLISLPSSSHRFTLGPINDDWNYPSMIQPEAARLLGVQDGLFYYMSKITGVRNVIRTNMEQGIDPVVDYTSLFRAAEIDAGIRDWTPIWHLGPLRELASLLYKQMMWVYLWRTIYPPNTTTWQPEYKITEVVNNGLELLKKFPPQDPIQTLLLAPTFIIGCAAFDPAQRPQIRDSIANIKAYTHLKNADRCLDVLRRLWQYMDEKDERSWDWQAVANSMGMDFLPT